MANVEHVALLIKQGVAAWNAWRDDNPDIRPDLSNADLSKVNLTGGPFVGLSPFRASRRERPIVSRRAGLSGANLSNADLSGANLSDANLINANLSGANLSDANLGSVDLSGANLRQANPIMANLIWANLIGSDLSGANLGGANLYGADLSGAHLAGASLDSAILVDTDLTGADLTGCHVYGVSAWHLKLEGSQQQNLVITPLEEPAITVDNIEVAQFVYLLLNNQKLRDVIDTVTSKAVLILGRFTQERKPVLEALREELRHREYLPILFDFEKPRSRNTDETITLLARMARFVVADISDAKSVLQELRAIVPDLPSVPVQPIILAMQEEPGMFDFYRNFRSFLNVHRYASQAQLIADLGEKVIRPAELKVLDLQGST
ncbi:MAG TPA: pentapeptide repeat-containing protein [Xanthobacteraceae bacterium]